MSNNLAINLLSAGWLLFLCLLWLYFFRQWHKLYRMKFWPITQGNITSFNLRAEGTLLWPDIEYRYLVDGEEYVSAYLFADTTHNTPGSQYSRRLAHRIAVAYQTGEAVDVYYNPTEPEQAVLDVRIPGKLKFIIILLSALIVLEIGLLVVRLFV